MTALVPIDQKLMTAKIILSSLQKSVRHLPLLMVVQVIINPSMISNLVQNLAQATPTGANVTDSRFLTTSIAIATVIYWAFLAGGTNLLLLALARDQPTKLSMIFSRRNLFRRYLVVGLLGGLCQTIMLGTIIGICFVPLGDSPQPAWIYSLRGLGVIIAAGVTLWLYAKFGFTDLAIADRDLDVVRAAKHSNSLSVGSIWKLVPFYALTLFQIVLFSILASTNHLGDGNIAGMHHILIVLLLLGSVGQTIINFWRVQIYCRLSKYPETIEKDKQGEVAL
jgi:hypothetical protein